MLSFGQLTVSDDFEGYSTTPTLEYGGTGPWTSGWSPNLEYGGGNFLDNGSNINGIYTLGTYGEGSEGGTSVSRSFPDCDSTVTISCTMKISYDVTAAAVPTNLRRAAFTIRSGNGFSHFDNQRLSLFYAAGSSAFQWYDGTDRSDSGLPFVLNHIYDLSVTMVPSNRAYSFIASNRNTGASIFYSGNWTEGTDGEALGSIALLMRGPSGPGNDVLLDHITVASPGWEGSLAFSAITEGSVWKFWRGSSMPTMVGTNHWYDMGYPDDSWEGPSPSGFGYGDCDDGTELGDMENNYVSVFTRKSFIVPDASAISHLTLAIDYDDGMVAYLNGQEIVRRDMPGGAFDNTTTASGGHEASRGEAAGSPDPKEFLSLSPARLLDGVNVIAASAHNLQLDSSDLTLITELYPNASLVRGPFIQMPDAGNKATVAWSTAAEVDAAVDYGLDMTYSGGTVSNTSLTRDHAVVLSGLLPGTQYYYRVRSNGETLSEGNAFTTRAATNQNFRFVVIGDHGQGTVWMYNIANQINARHDFDMLITVGDNIYGNVPCNVDGAPGWYDPFWFRLYGPTMKRAAVFPTLGNHDKDTADGNYTAEYFYLPTNGPATEIEKNYSFEFGNVHFTVIDSDPFQNNNGAKMAAITSWLSNDLANATQPWKFAFYHHPAYTSRGNHDDNIRVKDFIVPILKANGIQFAFQGHNHFYERINPINGINFITSGACGAYLYNELERKSFSARFVNNVHSYTYVEINGGRMKLQQFSEAGDLLDEYQYDRSHAFLMDGLLDDPSWERADNGLKLYAAIRGHNLYVATQDAGEGSDHFIYVADSVNPMLPANWNKAGSIMRWGAFLADENDGGYQGWFDTNDAQQTNFDFYKSMTSGYNDNAPFGANGVLEGSLDLIGHFGSFPQQVYLAAAPYGNDDGGALSSVSQVPAGNGNGDIEANEFLTLNTRDIALDLPVAQTGPDQFVEAGMWAVFDSSGSFSPINFPLTFSWMQTNGPAITTASFDQSVAAFVAQADVSTNTDVHIRLRVNDGRFDSDDATITITLIPIADSDNDGLTDFEEQLGFDNILTPYNPRGRTSNPNVADSDGDGLTDGEESVAGTDPADSNSVFKAVSAEPVTDNRISLDWMTTSGRLFHAQFADAPQEDWTNFYTFVATSSMTRVFDTNVPFGPQRLYRMQAED